jgi:hypothetical protein
MMPERIVHGFQQHDPPPSHRAPRHGDHDEPQHEPDLPDRRLAVRHQRSEPGLFGHLFNGYDTRFVKRDLKRTLSHNAMPPSLRGVKG